MPNEKKKNQIVAYKAMDKNMQCRGFQYEVGKTYEMEKDVCVCRKGFHACDNSLDVLNYYPRDSRFFKVIMGGEIKKENDKLASSSMYIHSEITFSNMFSSFFEKVVDVCIKSKDANTSGDKAHANTSGDKAHANTSGHYAHANTSGHYAHANTSGYEAHANTSGDKAHANTSGHYAHANTSGYGSHANTSGHYAHANTSGHYAHANTSGHYAHANTSGYGSHANTSGHYAHANTSGKNSIASAIGINSKAKADSGNSWINIFNWEYINKEWKIKEGFAKKPGQQLKGITIKVGYWYWFEDGKLHEEKGN